MYLPTCLTWRYNSQKTKFVNKRLSVSQEMFNCPQNYRKTLSALKRREFRCGDQHPRCDPHPQMSVTCCVISVHKCVVIDRTAVNCTFYIADYGQCTRAMAGPAYRPTRLVPLLLMVLLSPSRLFITLISYLTSALIQFSIKVRCQSY